jgi:drug/metabolite transporter, DME family
VTATASARIALVAAAILWSTSSVFIRILQEPTGLGLESPVLSPLQIAFFRSLFAGLGLLLLVRRALRTFRPPMIPLVICFGVMTALYLTALGLGPAANAILLQNTAPVWIYLVGVYCLGDPHDHRTRTAVIAAMLGAAVIVIGNWPRGLDPEATRAQAEILLMATGSGAFYAAVVLLLRRLNSESATWLTTLNLLGSALVIAGFIVVNQGLSDFQTWLAAPSIPQLIMIAIYGIVQLAVPYVLFAWSLRSVSPQEAGLITLIEPVLNPIWAWMLTPDRDTPTIWTFIGGTILLAALVWRYIRKGSG